MKVSFSGPHIDTLSNRQIRDHLKLWQDAMQHTHPKYAMYFNLNGEQYGVTWEEYVKAQNSLFEATFGRLPNEEIQLTFTYERVESE